MRYHQGRFTPKNPNKYEGDPTNIIYRSSWELKFFNWCDQNDSILKWSSEETVIPYICPTDNRVHRYFPDVKMTVRNRDGGIKRYLVEVKPFRETLQPSPKGRSKKKFLTEVMKWGKNQAKWEAAKKYCDKMGMEFKIITEKELGIK